MTRPLCPWSLVSLFVMLVACLFMRTLPLLRASTRPLTSLASAYWNREDSPKLAYDVSLPIAQPARILSLSDPEAAENAALHQQPLPEGAELLAVGTSLSDFNLEQLRQQQPNVVFVSYGGAREPLAELLSALPSIQWVHARSAGIDFIASPTLAHEWKGTLTNAKGQFSSTLAEYTLLACSYFAKDIPRLMRNKGAKVWDRYIVEELRGKTLGIVGFGDIGRAAAKLAKVYGMRIVALRRHPQPDPLADDVYPSDTASLNRLFAESDYILCAAPLTPETRGLIGAAQFASAKKSSAVFINVGRGPIVDEAALIEALQSNRLRGAALDVFAQEPLPESSPLWELDNVLLSPHNMDQTATFMHEATAFFVEEQLPRFVRQQVVLNQVDKVAGY